MTCQEVIEEIKSRGEESYKGVLLNHGVEEPCYGVKIEHLKKLQKRVKMDYALSLELFETGIYDAMYLAGLIADDARMSKEDLNDWVRKAKGPIAGCTVPWVASGSRFAEELAREWIEAPEEKIAVAGWTTLACLVSIKADSELDLSELRALLTRVERRIHEERNEVRYAMNGFVIAVGCYVKDLTGTALQVGERMGTVSVNMGKTACKVPSAPDYIRKVEKRGTIGKKRKTAKC